MGGGREGEGIILPEFYRGIQGLFLFSIFFNILSLDLYVFGASKKSLASKE